MKDLLNKYRSINRIISFEEEKEILYKYVFFTNKLEGNKLTYAQTTELLSSHTISGSNIKTTDILEQKGMYKALIRMLKAVSDKEELSVNFIKELNSIVLSFLWKDDDTYISSKEKGQKLNSFKIVQNVIVISKGEKLFKKVEPLSSPHNVEQNMVGLVDALNNSKKDVLIKSVILAKEIWLHQPFVDGNKRTARLLINFLTMKKGFPLFVYDDKHLNYNNLLVKEYIEEKQNLVFNYIKDSLIKEMKLAIKNNNDIKPNKYLGFKGFSNSSL